MDGRQRQLSLSAIHRYWSVSEELYAAGHRLHAFAALQSLVGPSSAIPPYFRREEIMTRVRAAEMLLHDSSFYYAQKRQQPKEGNVLPSVSSSSAIGAKLDLAQPVLSPMFATPRYFENTLLSALLFTIRLSNGSDCNATGENNEEENGERLVPISLLVKAYVLQAGIHRRRLRYAQAVSCIESAQQWCATVFSRKMGGSVGADKAKVYQRAVNDERCRCEAFLAVELCRVYYAQLTSSNQQNSSLHRGEAAVHKARATALDCLLQHAKNYIKYAAPDVVPSSESPLRVSPLCFSSAANSFSQRAAAQTLGCYYVIALVMSHRPVAAEMQLRQCVECFGSAPEFVCIAQLLASWNRGPRSVSGLSLESDLSSSSGKKSINGKNSVHGVKRPREETLRWTSDGLLRPLQLYLALHQAAVSAGRGDDEHKDDRCPVNDNNNNDNNNTSGHDDDSGAGGDCSNDPENHSVWRLFRQTLQSIDEHLTQLTTGHVVRVAESRPVSRILHSSPSADIRFLVLLKCTALVTVCGRAFGQLQIRAAVRHLLQLRQFISVFRQHTSGMRVHFHLLASQLAQFLSLRHLPADSPNSPNSLNSPNSSNSPAALCDGDGALDPRASSPFSFREKAAAERTAVFDVGLSYAHVLFAEEAARDAAPLCDPAALLLISVTKALSLRHAARPGAALQLREANAQKNGFARGELTTQQRHRCAALLARVIGALRGGESQSQLQSQSLQRQQKCAWTPGNRRLVCLLRGAVALEEERDEIGAARHFREALRIAREGFGEESGMAAESLQTLAAANRAEDRLAEAEGEREREKEKGGAQETMRAAWEAATHTSRLALLHCALTATGEGGESNRIIEEWEAEVSYVCLSMRSELLEVLSTK